MKIGSIDLGEHPVFLAPMEDVMDISFRSMRKRFGADMVYMEFVSSDALTRSVNKTQQKLNAPDDERPVAIQIYGKDVASMVEAARICEEACPDILDINFGCPVKKAAGKGAGTGMLRNISLMLETTRKVVKAVNIPVTVKTRLGWDADNRVIVDLAGQLQDCGIAALSIYGRIRAQTYTGEADWTLIRTVKNNPHMRIPIVGNGDVTFAEIRKQHLENYGVDTVMIGRASIDRPWIFRGVKHYLTTGELLPQEPFSWYLDILKKQVEQSVGRSDERRGVLHTRHHLAAILLFKGITDFKQTRIAMLRTETVNGLFEIMDNIPRKYGISE